MVQFDQAERRYIEMVHTPEHIKRVDDTIYNAKKLALGIKEPKKRYETKYVDENYDVYANKYSRDCAYLAAGASIECCKNTLSEERKVDSAFAAIRPPGHHACSDKI